MNYYYCHNIFISIYYLKRIRNKLLEMEWNVCLQRDTKQMFSLMLLLA